MTTPTIEPAASAKKRRTRLLIWALVAYVAVSLGVRGYQFLVERACERQVDEWSAKVQGDSSKETTLDEARDWLVSNGFDVTVWNPHIDRGWIGVNEGFVMRAKKADERDPLVVMGFRLLRERSLFIDPKWVRTTFCFDLEGRFDHVESVISPLGLRDDRGVRETRETAREQKQPS